MPQIVDTNMPQSVLLEHGLKGAMPDVVTIQHGFRGQLLCMSYVRPH